MNIGAKHFQLVSDPATHSYRDTLVSAAWCWENHIAVHTEWQFLKPGKVITPVDFPELSPDQYRWAFKSKLERIASFRQCQGYSKQIRELTDGDPLPLLASY